MKSRRPSLVRTLFWALTLLSVAGLAFSTWQGVLTLREGWNLSAPGSTPGPLVMRLILMAGLGLSGALLMAAWLSLRLRRELRELRQGADRIAAGHLEHRLPLDRHHRELAEVGDALNRMAATLAHQFGDVARHNREQAALLGGMREGVLALDRHGRLRSCNRAAGDLLGLGPHPVGALLQELLGREEALAATFASGWEHPQGCEHQLVTGEGAELRVWTHPLQEADGEVLLLGVVTDMGAVNRAERMRRDFVANVSHELKTPVTSIRGYVETLQDGAARDEELCTRFLGVIERQSRRLDAIIDDLLDLSRIERREEEEALVREELSLQPFLQVLLEDHASMAAQQQLSLRLELAPRCPARLLVEKALLERALVNLLSNAIRYGGARSEVLIKADVEADCLRLEVRDRGCGISAEHLPRIFERFYVVDKARSRSLGGTGLGLSIVKHAIQAQGGEVGVDSRPGEGSTFWLRLPLLTP